MRLKSAKRKFADLFDDEIPKFTKYKKLILKDNIESLG